MNHKATKSKTNTRLRDQCLRKVSRINRGGGGGGGDGVGVKALLQLANFILGPDATLNTEVHKKIGSHKGFQHSQCTKVKI